MRHITRKRLLSFFLAMALILTFSPISAAATYTPEEHEVDEDIAVTIAMLFVWANIGESEWNRKTTVDNIIPMYNNSDEVCAYCINLKNGSTNAGYITLEVSDPCAYWLVEGWLIAYFARVNGTDEDALISWLENDSHTVTRNSFQAFWVVVK